MDWEISAYDTQKAAYIGLKQEYLVSARLDNLLSCYTGLQALLNTNGKQPTLLVCNDHEEVGSTSANGAGSPVMAEAMRKVAKALSSEAPDMIPKSFCMSVDQAHAIHPNYASKHESQHSPTLNSGIVIKTNGNQRYATNSLTGFVVVRNILLS